jgi:hypothetical protein
MEIAEIGVRVTERVLAVPRSRTSIMFASRQGIAGPYAFILEDVGGRVVHWSGPVWSPQSSVLWGWHGQRCLPKLADLACFFFKLGSSTYFYRFSQFPSQLSRF